MTVNQSDANIYQRPEIKGGQDERKVESAVLPSSVEDERLPRKRIGRYDTPRPISQAITDWVIRSSGDRVIEPSAGSGVFVKSACRRLVELGTKDPGSQIWACDIDARAVEHARRSLPHHEDHVVEGDFLSLANGPEFAGREFDCVIGNPPFISMHRMDEKQRRSAWLLASNSLVTIDRKASLWAYFAIASIRVLKDGGNLGLILPASCLHSNYGKNIIKSVASRFEYSLLLSIRERCFLDDGAQERIVILLGEGYQGRAVSSGLTIEEYDSVVATIRRLGAINGRESKPSWHGIAAPVPLLMSRVVAEAENVLDTEESVSLGDLAQIHIGVVTGANKFFVLTESRRRILGIPESCVIPLLADFRSTAGIAFRYSDWRKMMDSDMPCWLLIPRENEKSKAVIDYLDGFPEEARLKNRTFSKRDPWYRPIIGKPPHAFLRYMGAFAPRILLSRFPSVATNSIHVVYFNKEVELVRRTATALSLHSSYSRLSAEYEGRAYGSGVLKLELSEARRLKLVLPRNIRAKEMQRCATAFEAANRRGNSDQATLVVDNWLVQQIPELASQVDFTKVRQLLSLAMERRRARRARRRSDINS